MKYTKTIPSCCAVALCMASAASAQTGLQFQVNGVVSPQNPTVTIDIYATYPSFPMTYGVANVVYDVIAGEGVFTNNIEHHYWIGWGTNPPPEPINHGDWLEDMQASKLVSSINPTPSPLLLHTIEWTTSDFTSRGVPISTSIEMMYIYEIPNSIINVPVLNPTNAFGMIQVIPTPSSSLALLAGAGLMGSRRRR